MVYLIAQLAAWLLLAAAFAALAGWSFAAYRSAGDDEKARRDRANIVRDLNALISDGANPEQSAEAEREREAARRMAEVREGRVVELERALEAARASANEAQARAAELQRALDAAEQEREQTHVAALEVEHEAVVAPQLAAEAVDPENDPALLTWRLRYLEQRVRYLEGGGAAEPAAEATDEPAESIAPPIDNWRARVAEARAAHAENEVRALLVPPPVEASVDEQVSPFAANADVDVLLRWRMLYLERRLAHMQAREPAALQIEPAAAFEPGPDPDCWKWRARYLEARARHLEERLSEAAHPSTSGPVIAHLAAPLAEREIEPEIEMPTPMPMPTARRVKPPVLQAARNGAPDDFTLIEGVSLLQQTTLYSLGVFHYDQVAAWSDEHVAWIDNYLRLRGRIDAEEWRDQASALAQGGPAARRAALVEEDL